jgi:voltage-gated potassium channel Kch
VDHDPRRGGVGTHGDRRSFPWRARVRYRIDETFARGTAPLMLWLAVVTLAVVLLAAAVLALLDTAVTDDRRGDFLEAFWASLLRTLDPGTMGGDAGWDFRLVSLLVTIAGIFVVSTLIGLIATGLDQKLTSLREGRGLVTESGHTLIIGFTTVLPTIVAELVEANASERDACVVVLTPTEKAVVDQAVRARVPDSRTTRIVCRTGDGSDVVDLAIVNPAAAKSVIVLADEETRSDSRAIRTVLALMTFDPELAAMRVVVQCHEEHSAAALRRVTDGRITTIVSDDVVGRLAAQACREEQLSAVYEELFDFGGGEIYFRSVPELVGATFAQAVLAFDRVALLGIRRADGTVELAPDPATVVGPDDQLVGVAEDDSTFTLTGVPETVDLPDVAPPPALAERAPEHFLFSGWSEIGPIILRELEEYVAPGSTVLIAADPRHCDFPTPDEFAHLERLSVQTRALGHHDTDAVVDMWTARAPDHVLLVSYRDRLTPTDADAEVLMSLLQLRHAMALHGAPDETTVVAELLDPRDVPLARASGAGGFLVSDRLTSLMIAQLSENPELDAVFADLLDAEGAEISLLPVPEATSGARPETFDDLVRLGLAVGDVVLGYRAAVVAPGVTSLGDGLVVNPPKRSAVHWNPGDQLIVVSRR